MLIEFRLTNFLSIREQATLSLVKGKGKELEAMNTFGPEAPATPQLLRTSAIYGANAAGKSNIIKALQVMRGIVLKSASEGQVGAVLPVTPFLLDESSANQPTEFEVIFVNQGVRYQYGFVATNERIIEEWLLAYPKGRPQRWIEREYEEQNQSYSWGSMDKLSGQKQVWQNATRGNALFLSTAIQLNSHQLRPVFEWFAKILHVAAIGGWNPAFSVGLCEKPETKNEIVTFLKTADVAIDGVQLEREKFDVDRLPSDMPETVRKEMLERFRDETIVNVKTAHILGNGTKVLFDMEDESDGTQKIFALAGPWLDTLRNGYVLVIDELHDNLHPSILRFLVMLFHSQETNPRNAQLVFVTHDTSILSQDVFRRDQIWFCEKSKEQCTSLYPLTDFSPRKGVESLERGYLSSRYGALPYIKDYQKVMGF